jgi:hypothetical protein
VICLVSAFIKSFLAVYEDKNGLAYTESGSGFGSSTIKHSSTATASNPRSQTSQRLQRLIGREEDEEPMIEPVQGPGPFQIVKTVRLSLHDEPIELADRRNARLEAHE